MLAKRNRFRATGDWRCKTKSNHANRKQKNVKGIIYTEFLEMVETKFSIDLAEQLIDDCNLPSGAVYTAVGTYDVHELLQLVEQLSEATTVNVPDLLQAFGRHLFGRFFVAYPNLFEGVETAFDFLQKVDGYIHVEVRKLYPDAELPRFDTRMIGENSLEMIYRSERPFGDLAEGLIRGCAAHFGAEIAIKRETPSEGAKDGERFILTCGAEVPQCSV